jgi:hypothetical protein
MTAENLLIRFGWHGPGVRNHLAQALRHALQLLELPGDGRELLGVASLLLQMELLEVRMMRFLLGMEGFTLLVEHHRPQQRGDDLMKRWSASHLSVLPRDAAHRLLPSRQNLAALRRRPEVCARFERCPLVLPARHAIASRHRLGRSQVALFSGDVRPSSPDFAPASILVVPPTRAVVSCCPRLSLWWGNVALEAGGVAAALGDVVSSSSWIEPWPRDVEPSFHEIALMSSDVVLWRADVAPRLGQFTLQSYRVEP